MKITTKIQHHFPIRRSVALIGAAILLTTVTANAEVKIGRLPSTSEGGGKVIGAKPNVFIIIDNGESMAKNPQVSERGNTDKGNLLQQTAGALIASLPQLEGKVRLGYTTTFPGVSAFKNINCGAYKLNGNVDKLDKIIPNLKSDLESNTNYLMADGDFIFKDSSGKQLGSGYGEITPRDFRDNYARYIYAWLGAMCPGTSNDDIANRPSHNYSISDPPYADLRDGESTYRTAAAAAKNPFSFPLTNKNAISFGDTNSARPLVSMHGMVLAQIADSNFLSTIGDCTKIRVTTAGKKQTGIKCKNLLSSENAIIDPKRKQQGAKRLPTDAYAPARASDGFPDQDGSAYGCRRNYEIVISAGPYGFPANLKSNTSIGNWGIRNTTSNQWTLPSPIVDVASSKTYTNFPKDDDYTRIFRHLKAYGQAGVADLPATTTFAGRQFLYSRTALQSYYNDLRSDLENIVPPFYASKTARNDGPGGAMIPPAWDRKNDPASWQHLTVFSLGFSNKFKSWKKAEKYQNNYSDLNPEDGELEGYLRAIEDGSIYADNAPYWDWARGNYQPKNGYIYRMPNGTESRVSFTIDPSQQGIDDPLAEMDFIKAGISSRGGAYPITDYASIKKVVNTIASRIETAMAQAVSGAGAVGGGSRVTASAQSAGGNNSTLFTTYVDEATTSGNLFAYRNCPLIEKEKDGKLNPDWIKGQCGQRLWNAASALDKDKSNIATKTIIPVDLTVDPSNPRPLVGKSFTWNNLDADLRKALQDGSTESDVALGKARLAWLNGKTREDVAKDTDSAVANVASKLRARPIIQIPVEGQRYKLDDDGNPIRDKDGNYTLLKKDAANTPNRIGEIVYATAKTVDPRGTLKASHPLNLKGNKNRPNDMSNYGNFVAKNIRDGKNEKRKPLVIVGANDGRLYGFTNPKDGAYAELAFSYIPRKVITDGRLKATTKDSWSPATAKSLVNGPFTVTDAQVDNEWGTYLVGTLGAGGSTVYALDITNGEAKFKWEIDLDNGGANIMSAPRIVWLREKCPETTPKCEPKGKWVVLLPSGYNAKDTSLIVLDLKDGSVISRIKTGADYQAVASESSEASVSTQFCSLKPLTSADKSNSNLKKLHDRLDSLGNITLPKQSNITCDNGLGDLTVTDADGDGGADYVYAGDLLGYVWKFNLTGFDFANPKNSELTVEYDAPLFIAETQEDLRQPITNMIEIGDGPFGEGSMMYFGTGRLFNQEERNITERQSFYAVWENPRYINKVNGFTLPLRRSAAGVYGFWRYEPKTLKDGEYTVSDDSSLKNFKEIRVIKRVDNLPPKAKSVDGKVVNVEPEVENFLSYDGSGQGINSATAQAVGWIIDFPEETNKERVLDRARTFEDMIFFSSFTPKTNDAGEDENVCKPGKPSIGGEGRFYMLNRLTGAPLEQSPFDFNGNGQNDKEGDNIKVNSSVVGSNTTSAAEKNNQISLSPASVKFNGSANFVELEAVLAQGSKRQAFCDYTRQVIFPGTADPKTGDPLSLTGCYQNRYRVWKQPVSK